MYLLAVISFQAGNSRIFQRTFHKCATSKDWFYGNYSNPYCYHVSHYKDSCIGSGRDGADFPVAALTGLCFLSIAGKVLITHHCFGYC